MPLFPPETGYSPNPSETLQSAALPATWTSAPIPTTAPAPIEEYLPEGLRLVYILDDTINLWEEGEVIELHTQEAISSPSISFDGAWITFNRYVPEENLKFEIWAIDINGNNLHRVWSLEDSSALSWDDSQIIIQDYEWMPSSYQLIFTTYQVIDGPPGVSPSFDLYLLDVSGELQQLAPPGEGGDYFPSPDGRFVAISTTSRISLIDLETGDNQILLEFDALRIPTEAWHTPELYWDRTSQHFTAAIAPPDIFTPSEWPGGYAGGLEQIWRMHISGQVELIAEVEPVVGLPSVLSISPYAEYYFSMERGKCGDGDFFISHLRPIPGEEDLTILPCWPEFPNWLPDGTGYYFRSDEGWFVGYVNEAITHDISFVRQTTADNDWPKVSLEWIDSSVFVLRKYLSSECELYLGTREGQLIPLLNQTESCPHIVFSVLGDE